MKNLKKHLDKQLKEQLDKAIEEMLKEALGISRPKEKEEEDKKNKKDKTKELINLVGKGATWLSSVLDETHNAAVAIVVLTAVLAALDDIGEELDYQRARKELLSAIAEFHGDIENSIELLSGEK